MELPSNVRTLAEEQLRRFCRGRIPENVQDKVRLLLKTKGCSITILEERPHYRIEGMWTLSQIAQFRYKASTAEWTLYCRDRNKKWWRFKPEKPSRDISDLIRAVDKDDTHIFWG